MQVKGFGYVIFNTYQFTSLMEEMCHGKVSSIYKVIALCTMQAEFIACYESSNQVIWLRNCITGLLVVGSIESH
jgi:hypothetical protein